MQDTSLVGMAKPSNPWLAYIWSSTLSLSMCVCPSVCTCACRMSMCCVSAVCLRRKNMCLHIEMHSHVKFFNLYFYSVLEVAGVEV